LYVDGVVHTGEVAAVFTPVAGQLVVPVSLKIRLIPSAGSHTFAIRSYVNAGTGSVYCGSGGAGASTPAHIRVSKIVQATQWPAVTTGTIICTSTTRPASPFEGQTVYETDTKRTLTYDGTGWYRFNQVVSDTGNLTSTFTTSATHTTPQTITGMSLTPSFGANRKLRFEAELNIYPSGGQQAMNVTFFRGSTQLARCVYPTTMVDAAVSAYVTPSFIYDTASTSGSDTFTCRLSAWSSNTAVSTFANGSVNAYNRFLISDIGPA
jgi:hypothetical protein